MCRSIGRERKSGSPGATESSSSQVPTFVAATLLRDNKCGETATDDTAHDGCLRSALVRLDRAFARTGGGETHDRYSAAAARLCTHRAREADSYSSRLHDGSGRRTKHAGAARLDDAGRS